MPGKLEDRVAIVTGSDSGIGEATAVELAREGADVAVTYRTDREGAQATGRAVEEQGQEAAVVELDHTQPKSVEHLFEEVRRQLGTPTILVNNAGIQASGEPVKEMDLETWKKVLSVNLTGPFLCSRKFLQILDEEGEEGDIVNISSVHEEVPMAGGSGYGAAKGGLRNLTRTLALEVGEHVNVNNVAPGMVLTEFNREAVEDEDVREERESHIPSRRAGEPEDIAPAVAYLASEEADYVDGETLFVDGGLRYQYGQGA